MDKTFEIKYRLINYYRFERQSLVATEVSTVGNYLADIMVYKDGYTTEIEIKTNKADFRNEFYKKEHKHRLLETDKIYKIIPNKFYFCVPIELQEYALEFIEKLNPKYGLLVCSSERGRKITSIKRGSFIHKEYSRDIRKNLINRACSELASLYEYKYINLAIKDQKKLKEKVI